jgi:hypothetical protein
MAIMLMLGALWIVTAIISIISILKGNRFQTNLLKQRLE